jgi:hypothetical protein
LLGLPGHAIAGTSTAGSSEPADIRQHFAEFNLKPAKHAARGNNLSEPEQRLRRLK